MGFIPYKRTTQNSQALKGIKVDLAESLAGDDIE